MFNSILASTIWRADDKTRIVWITMLAMADKHGCVESSLPGLADFARVSLADCEAALEILASPDAFSRTKEADGRRIEVIDGGWHIVNHRKYREKMGADERREYLKLKQREFRARRKQQSTNVNNVSDTLTVSTHAEAEADTEADADAKAEANADAKAKAKDSDPLKKEIIRKDPDPPKTVVTQKTANVVNVNTVNARSKRPIFTGQRFVVFEWQLDDLSRMLGPHTDDFDLHSWFFDLDAKAVRENELVPQRDGGHWLQAKTLAEAIRRGLPIASGPDSRTLGTIAAMQRFIARGHHDQD